MFIVDIATPIVADLEALLDDDRPLGLAALDAELHAIELARRELAAREARALGLAERYRLHTTDSHATMWGYLRADLGWSSAECRRRLRVARLVSMHPEAGAALADGAVPVAALDEIARAHANPRCGAQLGDVLGELVRAAGRFEHDDVKMLVDRWIMLADADGAQRGREATHANRNASVDVFADAGSIHAQLGALDGAEACEIFAHFVDAEHRTDWEAARAIHGADTAKIHLARTDAQRRADALMAIFRTAAAAPSDTRVAVPTVNVVVDIATLSEHLVLLELLPDQFTADWSQVGLAQRRCETSNGVPITPQEALQAAIAGLIRRLVVDADGRTIEASSPQRLFRGAARQVVMSQHPWCTHRGCRLRAARCQADHVEPHSRGGPTAISNGSVACPRHNTERYRRGYTTRRDGSGWHTYRPDGTEIGFEPPLDPFV